VPQPDDQVPATEEGLPAIQQLISRGVNVNVTLIFGPPRYKLVAKAYRRPQRTPRAGEDVSNIASVASFFLSRMDTLLDPNSRRFKERVVSTRRRAAKPSVNRRRQRQDGLCRLPRNL